MATKKTVTQKTAPRKGNRDKKGQKNSRDKSGKFLPGNKEAEKWTLEEVLKKLDQVWKTLTTDSDGNPPPDGNIMRVNDIKLQSEVCLMHGITKQQLNEWKVKFEKEPSVSDRLGNIKWLLEGRLIYSGGAMDQFVLKNHYEFEDKSKRDLTTDGESLNNPFYEFLRQTSNPAKSPKS